MSAVKLQLLLRPEHRTPNGVRQAVGAAAAMGFSVTATGAATLSAELDANRFEELFGVAADPVPAGEGTGFDFGSPPGFSLLAAELSVPTSLTAFVASISVATPHTRLR